MVPGHPWLLLAWAALGLASGQDCPSPCECQAQEVTCSDRNLSRYPEGIPLGTRRLRLAGNQLTYLPALSLGLLSDLVDLDCSHNQLLEVLDYTFLGVYRLLSLDLSVNRLRHISPHGFSTLGALLSLNLSHNPGLGGLHELTFANTTALRYLDLRHTGLATLDDTVLGHLQGLDTLYLSGNPWHCNCSLMDFTLYLLVAHLQHPDAENATCLEPPELAGWPLSQVGNPLRYMCLTHLDSRDYVFLLLIGFSIFLAGTVAAWLTGVCAVLYQGMQRRTEDADDEDELGLRLEVSRRMLKVRPEQHMFSV
ncbi:leucine-rich repeat-containing protein 52 [Sorex fumeus]|uniref:leucine-rich repeat-containing protein 52 n=1 Tax=Sorex fumeus TaxID=62283 RepID=UPI0024ADF841|nr:leucine-rich repeat-containing protein 52 [Sorex fumeus]